MTEYKTRQQKRKFYDSPDWKQIREEVKQRDNYECQECKRQGKVFVDTYEYSEGAFYYVLKGWREKVMITKQVDIVGVHCVTKYKFLGILIYKKK